MKRLALLLLLAGVFMGVVPNVTNLALGRTGSELSLFLLLNGVPERVGVLTSTGSSVSNQDAGTPFTLTGGSVIEVVCDGAGFINVGSATSSSDYTNANFGRPMTSGTSRWWSMRDSDSLISLDTAGTTVNCNVSIMR